MKSKFLVLLTILAAMCWAVVGFPSGAQAMGELFLTNGLQSKTITDNGVGDLDPAPGVVRFIGTNLDIIGWDSFDVTGSSDKPGASIDLKAIAIGGGFLFIRYSDDGFQLGNFANMAISGTQATTGNGTVDMTIKNSAFFGNTLIHDFTSLNGDSFAAAFSGPISPTNPTSLVDTVFLDHATVSGFTTFDASLNVVPLPPSALLLGSGLLGLVGFRFRRKKA